MISYFLVTWMRSVRVSQSGCNHSFAEIECELCQLNWWPFAFSVSYYLRKSHFRMCSSDAIYFKNSFYYLFIPQFCKLRSFYAQSCIHENCLLPSSFLSISLSICLSMWSAYYQCSSHWTDVCDILHWELHENLSRISKFV